MFAQSRSAAAENVFWHENKFLEANKIFELVIFVNASRSLVQKFSTVSVIKDGGSGHPVPQVEAAGGHAVVEAPGHDGVGVAGPVVVDRAVAAA